MTDADGIKGILLLDDDMDFRKLLKTILKKYFPDAEFHEYDPVAEGAPADDYDWSRYDVLVLDYYLCVHRLTGLDLLQKHHKKPGFPAAIMLTGAGTEETAVRASNFGVYDYLRKENLNKEELAKAIRNAFQKHGQERIKQAGREKSRSIFDKASFYKQLERTTAPDQNSPARAFVLIDIDNYKNLVTTQGPIASDNLGHFIARQIYVLPGVNQANPCITRLSGSAVGMLMDVPAGKNALKLLLENMCKHFSRTPFIYAGKTVPCSMSIGAVVLDNSNTDFQMLFAQVSSARDTARTSAGNSFHIYINTGSNSADGKPAISAKPVVASEPAVAPEPIQAAHAQPEIVAEPIRSVTDIPLDVDDDVIEHTEELNEPAPAESAASAAPVDMVDDEPDETVEETTILPPSKEFTKTSELARSEDPDTSEIVIDEAGLDENGLTVKHAIDENRIIQTYQPVIAMFNEGESGTTGPELFKADIQMIDVAGKVTGAGEFRSRLTVLSLQQYIDRWMLRQLIGRIVRVVDDEDKKYFLLIISEAWFSDIALFGWLRVLLSGLEQVRPGQYITLEIPADIYMRYQERARALIKTLRKTYGFSIALGNMDSASTALELSGTAKFDQIVIDYGLIMQSKNASSGDDPALNLIHALQATGAQIIVDGVENATILTDAISAGADYVMGNFTGEAQTSLQASAGKVETFEIS